MKKPDILPVTCPACRQGEDEPCVEIAGDRGQHGAPRERVHVERVRAFARMDALRNLAGAPLDRQAPGRDLT